MGYKYLQCINVKRAKVRSVTSVAKFIPEHNRLPEPIVLLNLALHLGLLWLNAWLVTELRNCWSLKKKVFLNRTEWAQNVDFDYKESSWIKRNEPRMLTLTIITDLFSMIDWQKSFRHESFRVRPNMRISMYLPCIYKQTSIFWNIIAK